MPEIPEFVELVEKILKTHKSKNDDYAEKGDEFFNFRVQEYLMDLFENPRDKVYACLVALKLARLASQLNKEFRNPNHIPNNEGTKDSFLDLDVYSILWSSDYLRRLSDKSMKATSESSLQNKLETSDHIHNFTAYSYVNGISYCSICGKEGF